MPMMTTRDIKRIMRFKERWDALGCEIERRTSNNMSINTPALERAALNWAMALNYGIAVIEGEVVALEGEERNQRTGQLEAAVQVASEAFLDEELKGRA